MLEAGGFLFLLERGMTRADRLAANVGANGLVEQDALFYGENTGAAMVRQSGRRNSDTGLLRLKVHVHDSVCI
jgi:hypothetical protein